VGQPADSGPLADGDGPLFGAGTQSAAARELIASVRDRLGDDYGAQDVAEAEHLTALAALVDANPTNISALRELRLTIAEFRRMGTPIDEDADEYLELVAKLSGWGAAVEASSRVYSAAIERGLSPAEARSIADAVDEC
jgi:hypothetical protein